MRFDHTLKVEITLSPQLFALLAQALDASAITKTELDDVTAELQKKDEALKSIAQTP